MQCLPLSPQEKTKKGKGKRVLQRLPFLCFSPYCVPNNGICSCCSLVPPSSVFSTSCENLWFLNPKVMFNTSSVWKDLDLFLVIFFFPLALLWKVTKGFHSLFALCAHYTLQHTSLQCWLILWEISIHVLISIKALLFPCLLVRFSTPLVAQAPLALLHCYDQPAACRNLLHQVPRNIQAACELKWPPFKAETNRVNSQTSTEICIMALCKSTWNQTTKFILLTASGWTQTVNPELKCQCSIQRTGQPICLLALCIFQ